MAILKLKTQDTNINEAERWASLIGGGTLLAFGLGKGNLSGFALAALGGGLVFRGATGHCDVYKAIGVNTSERGAGKGMGRRISVPYELGIRVDESIFIEKPPEEIYRFWRNLENLPKFMSHLESVEVKNDRKSHWVAEGPAGMSVEWDAEIVNEIEGELIGWRSLEGSEVDNAGSVRFEQGPGGTAVKVSLQYNPPAGSLGAAVAKLFGEDPKKQIRADLKSFKQLMEKGQLRPKQKSRADEDPRPMDKKTWDRDEVTVASEESFPASDAPSWTPSTHVG